MLNFEASWQRNSKLVFLCLLNLLNFMEAVILVKHLNIQKNYVTNPCKFVEQAGTESISSNSVLPAY